MYKYFQRILVIMMFAFLVLIAALIYWQIIKSSELLARPDNPRPHQEELRDPPNEK